jgi:hypothetical protein
VPGFRRALERRRFETILGIAGHGMETPQHLAVRGVIGGDIATHAHFAAAVADDDFPGDDARCTGDGVTLGGIRGLHRPGRLAGRAIERDQTTIERAYKHALAPGRDSAIHDVAAGIDRLGTLDLGVEAPQLTPGTRIEREYFAPRGRDVHDAIDHQRRRFLTAGGVEIEIPRQLQIADVALINASERTEALLIVSATVRQPLRMIAGGGANACGIHVGRECTD